MRVFRGAAGRGARLFPDRCPARVVVRNAVLALISLFHTILVDERDGEHRDVLPECAPESIVRQNRAQKTLHGVGRHRFARMVTRREQDCEFRSVFPECEQFHLPPFSAAAEYAGARRVPDSGGACRFVSREARTAPAAAPGLLKSHRSRLLKKNFDLFLSKQLKKTSFMLYWAIDK